jgi:hypothetical protein
MSLSTAGLTTIECLVALGVFAIGTLGAAGTTALALRTAEEGSRAAGAARLASSSLDSLVGVASPRGGCAALVPGAAIGAGGTVVSWAVRPAAAGTEVRLVLAYPTVRGAHHDSLWSYLPCH